VTSIYPIKENGALYDERQAEEYLAMLFRNVDWRPGQVFSILGIGEKGTEREGVLRDRHIIAPSFPGMIHGHLRRWAEWHGAGFIVPAVLHPAAVERGDVKLDMIAALTAIILDIDSGDVSEKAKWVTERLGRPTMVVASGGKTEAGKLKAHLYWLLSEPCDNVERVAALRKMLAAKVGGDQSFGRATQVIRIPGSVHAKHGVASVCHILDRCDAEYDIDDLADIIEGMQPMPGVEVPWDSKGPSAPAGILDFTPRQDTAVAALHRDIDAGGEDLTRWSEFSKVAGFYIAEIRGGRLTPEAAYNACYGWMLKHMNPPWPQPRFEAEFRGLVETDVRNHGAFPAAVVAQHQAATTAIRPTPATWPLAQSIPPRPWLFGRWLQRGIVTAMIAPGGVGKSSLTAAMMLSMSSGRAFLGKDIYSPEPLRTWYWNLEDSGDNLARARIAAALHHGVGEADCGDRMYVDSGPEGATLCTATEDRNGFTIMSPVFENIVAAIAELKIDVLVVDPFVSSHQLNENDNNKIDAITKAWARVAIVTGCAIMLVHHSKKLMGERVTAEAARGASSLNAAARMTLVLNRMTEEQAETWGIDPVNAQRFFSVADDKHNLSPPDVADWFELTSVCLNNGTDIHPADSVGVVTPWKPPRAMDGVEAVDLFHIQKVLAAGTYWRDSQAKENWAGDVIANVLRIDSVDPKSKRRINTMIETWLKTGALKIEPVRDESRRKMRNAVTVGHWAGDPNAYANYRKESEMATDEEGE
jgi:hypothetical protein